MKSSKVNIDGGNLPNCSRAVNVEQTLSERHCSSFPSFAYASSPIVRVDRLLPDHLHTDDAWEYNGPRLCLAVKETLKRFADAFLCHALTTMVELLLDFFAGRFKQIM